LENNIDLDKHNINMLTFIRDNSDPNSKVILQMYTLHSISRKHKNDCFIKSKPYVDAEYYMIQYAKEYYNNYKIWPVFCSKDQDLSFLILHNSPKRKNILIYNNVCYNLYKNNISQNIALLAIIFNKSDYFNGVGGVRCTINKIKKILNTNPNILSADVEYTKDYFIQLYKKNRNRNIDAIIPADNILLYTLVSDLFYTTT